MSSTAAPERPSHRSTATMFSRRIGRERAPTLPVGRLAAHRARRGGVAAGAAAARRARVADLGALSLRGRRPDLYLAQHWARTLRGGFGTRQKPLGWSYSVVSP